MFTIGHGTTGHAELVSLLHSVGVRTLVDVRSAPGSRRNPDASRARLAQHLPEDSIGYRWEPRLGGWRRRGDDARDTGLRNASFAGYAVHMRTAEFVGAVDDLLDDDARQRTAVMCAEQLWWRCHRRMIADFLVLVHGLPVRHVMHDGDVQEHRVTDVARRDPDGLVVYDAGQQPLSQ